MEEEPGADSAAPQVKGVSVCSAIQGPLQSGKTDTTVAEGPCRMGEQKDAVREDLLRGV